MGAGFTRTTPAWGTGQAAGGTVGQAPWQGLGPDSAWGGLVHRLQPALAVHSSEAVFELFIV